MLLTKTRVPVAVGALIFLLGLILALIGAASADPANDNPFGDDAGADFGWNRIVEGQQVGIDIFLTNTLANQVFAIEVFLAPTTTGTKPAFTHVVAGGMPFPTGQLIPASQLFFTLDQVDPAITFNTPPVVAGIHLMGPVLDSAGNRARVRTSSAPVNTGLLVPPAPTATPVVPTPTPVPTTVVPEASVTPVPAPTGGASKIVQPNAATSLSAPDGSVTVNVPITAHSTTFQLVYGPRTTGVPAGTAAIKVLRAFDLNAHNTSGAQISINFINPLTIIATYTNADAQAAPGGNAANLKILNYDATNNVWVALNTQVNIGAQTLTAQASHLSLFAVGSSNPGPQTPGELEATPTATPTATATPKPPGTGDFAPGSGLMLGLLLVGFLMVAGSTAYLLQTRKTKA
ncbi:MAG: hypothetical protein HY532_00280 [Chloroflexi bacterium]|nr:hypothetical protein [Chloroflexota bacterium]